MRARRTKGFSVVDGRWRAYPRSFLTAALGSVLLGTVYLVWLVSDHGTAATEAAVSEMVFVIAPLFAAWGCWRAHRRDRASHSAWWWISVGCLTWAGGSVTYAVHHLVLGEVAPIPSLADVGYIGYALPVMVGVLQLPRVHGTVWSHWRSALDSLVIASCLLLSSALLVLDPILDATTMTPERATALAYPLVDLLVASTVLARCVVMPGARPMVWVPLSLGLVVLSVTDSVYVASRFLGSFLPGGPLDLGWFAAFALIGLAGMAPAPVTRSDAGAFLHAPGFVRQLFPSVAVGVAAVACVVEPDNLSREHHWWLVVVVVLCIALRTLVVVADQTSLARDLARAVDRRTAELRHQERWWHDIVQNLSDVVLVIAPTGSVLYCSPGVNAALGHMPSLGSADELLALVHPDDEGKVLERIGPVIRGPEVPRGCVECRIRRSDGSFGWFEADAAGRVDQPGMEGTVLTLHDVSERRELTDRLQRQAHHDALTGLPNRALLMQRIDETLAAGPTGPFGLLLLDLDDFKVINDRHGHAAGDLVLTVIGRRLADVVRAGDTVARLGGDEFAHLVHGSAAEVRAVAERLVAAVEQPVVAGGRRFHVRTSVGAVLAAAGRSDSAAALLSHADIALYKAKADDKGGIVLIEGASRNDAAQQVQLREQVAQPALEQFAVVYQPIVDLRTGMMRGVEALLRWNHPDLGPVPPDVFIPMAEHGGSIGTLGWFVLEQACSQLAAWGTEAPGQWLGVGVNLSVRQLDEPDFATRVADLIASFGIEPDQVVLELTEESIAVDFETAVTVVAQLRASGLSVAVDDYGTGYSSLRYLHRFDANVVKVDRSFVANVVESVHTQKIVRSVMHMARSLDLQSISEGIETREQLEVVRSLGCELGQGYLFSRPVPPAKISVMLRDGVPLTAPAAEPVSGLGGGQRSPTVGTGPDTEARTGT